QVGPSEAIHSDPRALNPLGQLADVDLILLGHVSLLRILLSVLSVVIRSSYLPESSPGLSAPGSALRSWRAGAVPFTAKICRPVSRGAIRKNRCLGAGFLFSHMPADNRRFPTLPSQGERPCPSANPANGDFQRRPHNNRVIASRRSGPRSRTSSSRSKPNAAMGAWSAPPKTSSPWSARSRH